MKSNQNSADPEETEPLLRKKQTPIAIKQHGEFFVRPCMMHRGCTLTHMPLKIRTPSF